MDGEIIAFEPDEFWAIRGHLTQAEAAEWIQVWAHGDNITPGPVRHEWWRAVPEPDGGGSYHEATPHARGAFRVTVCPMQIRDMTDAGKAATYRRAIREALRLRAAGVGGAAWAVLEQVIEEGAAK